MSRVSNLICRRFILASAFLIALQASALTEPVRVLINMETKANAVAVRNNEPVRMPHYEIPLRLVQESKVFNMDPKIYESLVFKKHGEDYVRWIVNPEDTKWNKDVEAFMVKNGLEPVQKHFFTGYQTASRSYIVEDPSGKVEFSIKASTDRTGGAWRDKKQEFQDAFDIRVISDLLVRAQKQKPFEKLVIMT